jgi:hypothetical protein
MKLSKETLTKLKNFAEVNSNLLIKSGSNLSTVSPAKNVAVETKVAEVFDFGEGSFGIYDLNEFMGVLSLFENPELQFSGKFVEINEGSTSIKYFSADESVLVFPSKSITFPEPDIQFNLDEQVIASIRKVAGVLKTLDVSFVGDKESIIMRLGDRKNNTASSYSAVVGTTDKEFSINLKVDNLKLLPGNYSVAVAKKKISRFVTGDVTYYIAVEADSTFGEGF